MKGKLLEAKLSMFQALIDDNKLGWELIVETRFFKRKVKFYKRIPCRVDLESMIGKSIEIY